MNLVSYISEDGSEMFYSTKSEYITPLQGDTQPKTRKSQ